MYIGRERERGKNTKGENFEACMLFYCLARVLAYRAFDKILWIAFINCAKTMPNQKDECFLLQNFFRLFNEYYVSVGF